ncbi:class I SAM-dependent methyltransferase [Mesobacterium pallidum]|uniref:class I SAM-dependent methyltransferase n=1 Tax=Mesobacterium pallidum TaxID=2872037 RepID=UPI001EE24504|nr:class I SAM-dependent methyltransferase [Mesobacterium pallidum]
MSNASFWDNIAAKYAARPIAKEEVYQRKLRETQALLTPEMELLEIGCGTGGTALAHAPYVREVLATDISDAMLEFGRKAAAERGLTNLRFERAAVDELDPEPASRDMVLMLSLLHLLDDPEDALAMAARTLRPGGYLVISSACLGDGMTWLKPAIAVAQWLGKAPATIRFFRQDELLDMIRAASFGIETCWRPDKRSASFVIARKPGAH